jgi:hypothetical protein
MSTHRTHRTPDFDRHLADPADDRDELTDDDVAEAAARLDCEEMVREVAYLDTDADLLKWARDVKRLLVDAAVENAEADRDARDERNEDRDYGF